MEVEMGKSAIQQGGRAVIECEPFGACNDDELCCKHCGEHVADPHQPTCPHSDEPVDECDARPAEEVFEVHVEVRAADGLGVGCDVLEALKRAGFRLHRDVAGVWEKREHGPSEFVGVARLASGEVVERG
ncbi:hypothetical protein [Micromonospora cathayae]|uniref:Uncharacterized protein n=1 Tax=Micromonospora cathayae TaxID=3028804 RepID=A0ABY7ZM18_9ACTN|nr:hypothetical protein [Micromonospora sp. HUAS 3]WDZ84019.1 hypothetical protein PVK37_26685 [Micromonospora sp. HUAS 3]